MVYCLCSLVSEQEDQTINLISNPKNKPPNQRCIALFFKFGQRRLVMAIEPGEWGQSETEKYFERIMILNV